LSSFLDLTYNFTQYGQLNLVRFKVVRLKIFIFQPLVLFAVDAIYLSARSLGQMAAVDGVAQLTNGTLFREYSSSMQFAGVSGRVALDVLDPLLRNL
jgi:hypothetical protein